MRPEEWLAARKPWIFVDEVISCVPMQQIITRKHITYSDFFLIGHFPAYSVYPGVLLLEGLIQSAGLLRYYSDHESKKIRNIKGISYPVTSCNARFLKPAKPGATIEYTIKFESVGSSVLESRGIGVCDGETVIRACWKT